MRTTETGKDGDTFASRARRAQLVDCAVQALCDKGYSGTSVAEVARRAGVSKGVVTYHFPSKDELLRHVVLDLYVRGGERLAGVEDVEAPLDALDAYVVQNLAFVFENPAHVRAAMEVVANLRGPAGDRSFPSPGHDPVTAHLRGLIEDGQRAGMLARVDAHTVAMVVRAAIDAAAAAAATDPDFPRDAFLHTLRHLVRATLEPVS